MYKYFAFVNFDNLPWATDFPVFCILLVETCHSDFSTYRYRRRTNPQPSTSALFGKIPCAQYHSNVAWLDLQIWLMRTRSD